MEDKPKKKFPNPDTQFKKGNQASKGKGRPKKLPNLEQLLAEVLGEEFEIGVGKNKEVRTALEIILKAQRHKASKGDTKAAQLLLERAYGKSKQFIEQVNKNEIDLSTLPDDQLFLVLQIQEGINKKKNGGSNPTDSVS